MSFKDLLNSPLPSQVKENAEDNADDIIVANDERSTDEINDMAGDNDNDDFGDELTDDDLKLLAKDLEDETVDTLAGDEEEIELSPEEEREADDTMALVATSMIVNDELNGDEKEKFIMDEGEVAVKEGFISETDLLIMSKDLGLVKEGAYNKKMIIRLDKESRMKQLFALGVRVSASAKNDPDYIKYKKILRMKKIYQKKLEKKYKTEAIKRMKVWWKRLSTSKSPTLKKIAQKNNVNKK